VPKEQKTTITSNADVIGMSAGMVDIDDTPDVATWNKQIHIKGDAAGIMAEDNNNNNNNKNRRLHEPEKPPPLTVGIGLIQKKKGSKKEDLIIDPADKKEVEEAIRSGSTLTDEAVDL
jgi:hypothetical protein